MEQNKALLQIPLMFFVLILFCFVIVNFNEISSQEVTEKKLICVVRGERN
jgi:hypothetical protein